LNKFIVFVGALCLSISIFAGSLAVKQAFGPTVVCDDLWQIANQLYDEEITVPQIMIAILKSNPKAFCQDNVNGLFSGVELSIPSVAEIKKIQAEEAALEVKQQNIEWQSVVDGWAHKHSKRYLSLRQQCCTPEHLNHLPERFHQNTKVQSSVIRAPDKIRALQTVQVEQVASDHQMVDLQSKIAELTKENEQLQSALNHLKAEKKILQHDNLLQWLIIEALQQQAADKPADKTLATVLHQFRFNHQVKESFLQSVQSGRQILQEQGEDLKNLMIKLLTQFVSADPLIVSMLGSLIFLFIVLLWAVTRYKKQGLPQSPQAPITAEEVQEEIESEDIMATKLDLARVYIDMGEHNRARNILKNVLQNGDKAQQLEAQTLLKELARK
jgi:FimV-like protein